MPPRGRIRTLIPGINEVAAYATSFGAMIQGESQDVLVADPFRRLRGQVQLIFTSPPFPLNTKKQYGNLQGEKYIDWLVAFGPLFRDMLRPDGSIVIELGNSWEPGKPVMSTLALKALLRFQEENGLHLCQEIICHNPTRLPSPAQWVTIERIRLKDSYTRLWWLSPSPKPKASNKNVLAPYSDSMKRLIRTGKYNAGARPSGHVVSERSFSVDNGGAISPSVLSISNTNSSDDYMIHCRDNGHDLHPARMPIALPDFFIRFLTDPGDLVVDPFGGSNTTGAAAEALKRNWIAIEPNPEYIEGSLGRFPSLSGSAQTEAHV